MIRFTSRAVLISPTRSLALAGRSARRLAVRCHDPLEANILIVDQGDERIVLVAIDALFVGRCLTDEIIDTCRMNGVNPEGVIVTSSHTHSAPALEATKPLLGEQDDAHFSHVCRTITHAIKEALQQHLTSADVHSGHAALPAGVNRRKPWPIPQVTRRGIHLDRVVMAPNECGPIDPTATAIILRGAGTTAVIWHYACHPTGFTDDAAISADFPGVVRAALRQRFGADTAVIFLQGFAGDIRPPSGPRTTSLSTVLRFVLQGPRFYAMSTAQWENWSATIATAICRICDTATIVEEQPVEMQLASLPLRTLLTGASGERTIEMQRVKVLGQNIVVVSAEPLIGLRDLCPQNSLCVGYSRDVFGYWPRTDQLRIGGYEVNGFKHLFGIEGSWRQNPDHVFAALLDTLN